MGKALTEHQLGEYQQRGFLFPLSALAFRAKMLAANDQILYRGIKPA